MLNPIIGGNAVKTPGQGSKKRTIVWQNPDAWLTVIAICILQLSNRRSIRTTGTFQKCTLPYATLPYPPYPTLDNPELMVPELTVPELSVPGVNM